MRKFVNGRPNLSSNICSAHLSLHGSVDCPVDGKGVDTSQSSFWRSAPGGIYEILVA